MDNTLEQSVRHTFHYLFIVDLYRNIQAYSYIIHNVAAFFKAFLQKKLKKLQLSYKWKYTTIKNGIVMALLTTTLRTDKIEKGRKKHLLKKAAAIRI